MARGILIVNPAASRVTPELVAAVARELGDVEAVATRHAGHGVELAEAASREFDRIYVLAGDGGLNEVVNGLARPVPLGFLPGGATSVVTRALGLPRDPVDCARSLAASARTRRISLGCVNGRRFLFSAGIGLDAEIVRAVDRSGRARGRRPGDLAYVRAFLRILVERRGSIDATMTVDGGARVAFALVANCDPYTYFGPFAVHVAPRARFELGLDLVAPLSVRARQLPALAYSLLVRARHAGWPQFLYRHDVDEVAIECDETSALQADGEDLGDVREAVFAAERGALEVIV